MHVAPPRSTLFPYTTLFRSESTRLVVVVISLILVQRENAVRAAKHPDFIRSVAHLIRVLHDRRHRHDCAGAREHRHRLERRRRLDSRSAGKPGLGPEVIPSGPRGQVYLPALLRPGDRLGVPIVVHGLGDRADHQARPEQILIGKTVGPQVARGIHTTEDLGALLWW